MSNKGKVYDEVPNLDAMTQAELMDFWMRYQNCRSHKEAARLFGGKHFRGYTIAAASLGGYASNKATAMACRLRGDILAAQVYEQICENIYNSLPEIARW